MAVPPTDSDQQPIVISLRIKGPAHAVLYPKLGQPGLGVCFPRRGENNMRRSLAFASIAHVAAILAFWGAMAALRAENPDWTEQMSEALRKASE
jgi:hypothetical protein